MTVTPAASSAATIKQGTNHIHGDAFEFYRDTFLNTNNFFQKQFTNGVRTDVVSPYHQNIFGGTSADPSSATSCSSSAPIREPTSVCLKPHSNHV